MRILLIISAKIMEAIWQIMLIVGATGVCGVLMSMYADDSGLTAFANEDRMRLHRWLTIAFLIIPGIIWMWLTDAAQRYANVLMQRAKHPTLKQAAQASH